jgi:hypothetical protein
LPPNRQLDLLLVTAAALLLWPAVARAQAVTVDAAEPTDLARATVACKVVMGPLTKIIGKQSVREGGTLFTATCQVLSPIKGNIGKVVSVVIEHGALGLHRTHQYPIKPGQVYLIMLGGKESPYLLWAAMPAAVQIAEQTFGTEPEDRLLAELVAMWSSPDEAVRVEGIRQIGILGDKRAADTVRAAAMDDNSANARAGVIAQYRLKITPDAKRVMEVFDKETLDVWYDKSGEPQAGANGRVIWRYQGSQKILQRGLPDFDYATYVREGIKYDWVRKDDRTLYLFFGVPWSVQRPACVPELIKLLDHPEVRVRWWAVTCLLHTVDNKAEHLTLPEFEGAEAEQIEYWRKWWKEKGESFMAPSPFPDEAGGPVHVRPKQR